MFEFINKTNQLLDKNEISKQDATDVYNFFKELNEIFGIIDFKKVNKTIPAEIRKLAKERELARKNLDWKKSDEIRAEIEKKGFLVQDSKNGPVIKSA